MPLLSDLLSGFDSAKRGVSRRLSDLIQNPGATMDQWNDQAGNWNNNVQPTIQGGLLSNRPMTQDEIDQKYTNLALDVGPMGIGKIAWHGSPHKFDKFSLDKIGTGEGAQAYGHGLYLAESPAVANQYLRAGKDVGFNNMDTAPTMAGKAMAQAGGDIEKAMAILDDVANNTTGRTRKYNAMFAKDSIKNDTASAHIYKTDIPDEAVARFLDWDKPLSQQAPEVQKAFESRVSPIRAEMAKPADPGWGDLAAPSNFDPTGQELLGLLRNRDASLTAQQFLGNGLGPDISTALKQQGIPGIRYLDGGSRSAGQGSSNFVAFDPEMIRILERNGQPTGLQPWKPGEYRLGDLVGQ